MKPIRFDLSQGEGTNMPVRVDVRPSGGMHLIGATGPATYGSGRVGCYGTPTGTAASARAGGIVDLALGQVAALAACGAVVLTGVQQHFPESPALTIVDPPMRSSKELIASLFDASAATARAEAEFAAMEASSASAERRALAAIEADAGDWIYSDV